MKRLLAVLVLAGVSAQAEITYYFGGTLSESIGGFDSGTPFSGFFSYSLPTGPSYLVGSSIGYDLQVSIGGTVLNVPPMGIFGLTVQSGELYFERRPVSGANYPQNNGRYLGFGLKLIDSSEQNLGSYPPDESLRIPMLTSAYIWISEYFQILPESEYQILSYTKTQESQSSLTSLVPEPSSLSLLLAGGAVLMAGRRRK